MFLQRLFELLSISFPEIRSKSAREEKIFSTFSSAHTSLHEYRHRTSTFFFDRNRDPIFAITKSTLILIFACQILPSNCQTMRVNEKNKKKMFVYARKIENGTSERSNGRDCIEIYIELN